MKASRGFMAAVTRSGAGNALGREMRRDREGGVQASGHHGTRHRALRTHPRERAADKRWTS